MADNSVSTWLYGSGVGTSDPPHLTHAREVAATHERSSADLVFAAGQGDQLAWGELVDRYASLVWSVARAHRLGPADAADVTQTTWLRLVENLGRLRNPQHVGGWLATTARHECLRLIRRAGREIPEDDLRFDSQVAVESSPEWLVLASEGKRLVWLALSHLSHRCQLLLRALASSPDSSYAEISSALDMPMGSIGPTRSRCLKHLRQRLAEYGVLPDHGP